MTAESGSDNSVTKKTGAMAVVNLPVLREEIDLHPGPREKDGYPTWTLHDPVTNQFYRLGWQGFEILRRFENFQTVDELLADVNAHTTLHLERDDVLNIVRFLYANELAQSSNDHQARRLAEKSNNRKKAWWKQAAHSYLFLRIPLVRPDPFLECTKAYVRPLFTRAFFIIMLGFMVLGMVLTLFRVDEFANTFMHFFSWQGLLIYIISLVFVKICHELAHAYSAKLSGVEVTVMGVALIVLYPVLYTDTSGAWKIVDKNARLRIGYAGVMAEFYLAACALVLWHFLPDGALKSAAFFIATVSFLITVSVNFNPFMRFDGYYLLADMLGIDNLQYRAFALTKWHLRGWILGVKAPKPEQFKPSLQRLVIVYGYATWVYRFFLFVGIAILIFYLFPQPIGVILMVVELGFFIVFPIAGELKIWWEERQKMSVGGKRVIGGILAMAIFMAVFPWRSSVEVPAVMQAQAYQKVNVPISARIDDMRVQHGQIVEKGDVLLVLRSDSLDSKITQVQHKVKMLGQQINIAQRNQALIKERPALVSKQREEQTRLDSLISMRDRLTLRADTKGQVFYAQDFLHEGLWLSSGDLIMEIVNTDSQVLYAYVDERSYGRIQGGAAGTFYPDNVLHVPLPVKLQDVDTVSTRYLNYPELASVYGGPIAVDAGGQDNQLIAHNAIYRLRLAPVRDMSSLQIPSLRVRGAVVVEGRGESLLYNAFRHIRAVVIREFGI
ncbi:MAG: hypothetical protein CMH27_03020 [Micavibrio sp.]|nr:hypothetical protein [Micavibrio sp.]